MVKKLQNKLILVVIILLVIAPFFIFLESDLDRKVIPASFLLGERTGFDLTPGELTFGRIEINQSAARDITISNNFNKPIKISIESSGEISKNLIVSENNFQLIPSESRNITFSIQTRGLTEFKEYSGEVTIISRKI